MQTRTGKTCQAPDEPGLTFLKHFNLDDTTSGPEPPFPSPDELLSDEAQQKPR
jgi:hypothetical protein